MATDGTLWPRSAHSSSAVAKKSANTVTVIGNPISSMNAILSTFRHDNWIGKGRLVSVWQNCQLFIPFKSRINHCKIFFSDFLFGSLCCMFCEKYIRDIKVS